MKNMETTQRNENPQFLKRFLPYYRPYLAVLFIDLFSAGLSTLGDIILPLLVRQITNLAITDLAQLTVKYLVLVGALYILIRLIDTVANYYMQSIGHIMGSKIEKDMRSDLFAHLQKLSLSFFNENKIGQIMARITSDLNDITEFAHHFPEEMFIALLKITLSFFILLTINVQLTALIFIVLPIMIYVVRKFNRKMRQAFADTRRHIGELNSQVEDSLLGIQVVKAFANEQIEIDKFEAGNLKFLTLKERMYYIMASFQVVTRFFDTLMYIIVMVVGGLFLMQQQISAADYVAYLMYITTLLASVRRMVEFMEQYQRGMTGVSRFFEVMDADIEIFDEPDAINLANTSGEIIFDEVCFRYEASEERVLNNLSFKVAPGENLAFVGPSGAGKTTIIRLLQRFYDVKQGAIYLDQKDIRTIALKSLRNQIGVVQQDVYLFSGTIKENIAYGKPTASLAEIKQAAKLAGAERFIEELPSGYETYVGERGTKLSGGQKQRIAIARVFLKNPPILILDEATSALDNENERIIQESLEQLTTGRTTITIAHRLTTIKQVDRIMFLTPEGIVESGSHQELLARHGHYYDLYQLYTDNH